MTELRVEDITTELEEKDKTVGKINNVRSTAKTKEELKGKITTVLPTRKIQLVPAIEVI